MAPTASGDTMPDSSVAVVRACVRAMKKVPTNSGSSRAAATKYILKWLRSGLVAGLGSDGPASTSKVPRALGRSRVESIEEGRRSFASTELVDDTR
eukprot:1188520-Prorocentrum_minimum.AAC.2